MPNDAERRAYYRGYAAGSRGRWPDHRPPLPPHDLIRRLMQAAQQLRDDCAAGCATFDPDDEFTRLLAPSIDAMDEAMAAVTEWLKAGGDQDAR